MSADNPFLALSAQERLRAHADAAKAADAAKEEYYSLSDGEHPQVLEDSWDNLVAASLVVRQAYRAYTNPFGVDKYA